MIRDLEPQVIAARYESIRERTLALISGLDWPVLEMQHVPILSPMVWDLGHIAHFEELWLCQELGGRAPLEAQFARLFDAVLNPRPTRKDLSLPVSRDLWSYMARVRAGAMEVLAEVAVAPSSELVARGFLYEMVAEHEEQHQETLLQLLQVLDAPPYQPAQRRRLPRSRPLADEMVEIPAGPFRMGSTGRTFAYDNEQQSHQVELPAFAIDRAPVTCGKYLEFVEAGGYRREQFWSRAGWDWRREAKVMAPGNWSPTAAGWQVRHMERIEPLQPDLPVVHVCFHEAEAYARFRGLRLPSEAEWEKAALWDAAAERSRLYPFLGSRRIRDAPTSISSRLGRHRSVPTPAAPRPTVSNS